MRFIYEAVLQNLLKQCCFPGLFDSSIEPKSIGNEIAKCISMAKNGIHAVLVVVSLGVRYSLEEASAIESLRQFFGGKIGDYMILVFTHGDALRKMSLDDFLARNCPEPLEVRTFIFSYFICSLSQCTFGMTDVCF